MRISWSLPVASFRPGDYEFLYNAGVKAIFGPGTPITESADKTLALLEEKYLRRREYLKP